MSIKNENPRDIGNIGNRRNMTNTEQNRENQTYGQHGLHQKLVVNPGVREGYVGPVSV